MSKTLILYSSLGCHLCEEAKALIAPLLSTGWLLEEIDVADDDCLMERYGVRIPVIKRVDNDTELCWPFSVEQAWALLS